MSPRVLLVAAAPLVSLSLFSTFVIAGVNVTANCTLPSYDWTFNSLGQSPCLVAATMLATCYGGSYSLAPLPPGDAYSGTSREFSNKCECSTVGYSLISACVVCQGHTPFYTITFYIMSSAWFPGAYTRDSSVPFTTSWSAYTDNCTSTLPPSQFPNPVPSGIYVPHWAILDVTDENNWDANASLAAGDTPEYGPGAIFGPSGVYTTSTATRSASPTGTSSSTPSGTLTSPSKGSNSNTGAIVGGVMGSISVISIAVAAIFYLRRRSRSRAPSARSAGFDSFQPYMGDMSDIRPLARSDGGTTEVSSPSSQTRFSDVPNDLTFQGYSGPHSVDHHHYPGSHIGPGNNLANLQTSLPLAKGYHGLPMPSA